MRLIRTLAIGLTTLSPQAFGQSCLPQIVESVRQVCTAPGSSGKYWSVNAGVSGDAKVKFTLVGNAAAKAEANFSKAEWEGVQRVLQSQQATENANYRECAKQLTPVFLQKVVCDPSPVASKPAAQIEFFQASPGRIRAAGSRTGVEVSNISAEVLSYVDFGIDDSSCPSANQPQLVISGDQNTSVSGSAKDIAVDLGVEQLRRQVAAMQSLVGSSFCVNVRPWAVIKYEFEDINGNQHRRYYSLIHDLTHSTTKVNPISSQEFKAYTELPHTRMIIDDSPKKTVLRYLKLESHPQLEKRMAQLN